MPLEHKKSHSAFEHNLKAEMHAGKPMKQSLAIAYAVKRKAKKMAHGGQMTHEGYQDPHNPHHDEHEHVESQANMHVPMDEYHIVHNEMAAEQDAHKLNQHGADEIGPEGRHYAEGGDVERPERHRPYSSEGQKGWTHEKDYNEGVHRDVSGSGESYVGSLVRKGFPERAVDRQKSQMSHNKMSPNPKLKGLAYGGEPEMTHEGYESTMHEDDMVDRIMKKRQHMYSEGGKVANDTHEFESDFEEPNEFDDLVQDDHLEAHEHGSNEHGDEYDADHSDIVSRIMLKRKKQHNPNPA